MIAKDVFDLIQQMRSESEYWKAAYYAAIKRDEKIIRQIRLDTEKKRA